MFLHLTFILYTGGGCLPLGPGGVHLLGRHLPPLGKHPPGHKPHPPPRDGHCSGRYASYWNAFLYYCMQKY